MTSTWKAVTVGAWLMAALWASVWAELDSRLDEHWELWKKTHEKIYKNEVEELGRRAMWEKTWNEVAHHNLGASLGLHTYTLGLNHLSDLTKNEKLSLVFPITLPEDYKMTPTPLNITDVALPASVDWRTAGYVTSVKDQTWQCLSCWAFSAAGALEGLWAKTKGRLVDLSPQNLMDCSRPFGSYGCHPGFIHHAFDYVIANDGVNSEAYYPYEARDGTCRYNPNDRAATCSRYRTVVQDELSLQQAVATIGPIAVHISETDIIHYSSGVYNNPQCSKQLNHGVLAVGYGTDQATGLDYWILKNSRGPGWGENGYIRLARNKNQMCGISMYSIYPL